MDQNQLQQFLELQAQQQQQINQLLQSLILTQQSTSASARSDNSEHELKNIIKNFKCEKYDNHMAAETFLDYFESQCRMWGLENKPDNSHSHDLAGVILTCGFRCGYRYKTDPQQVELSHLPGVRLGAVVYTGGVALSADG
ncbi:hypothetical protein FQR65_LT15478 [Abscondita terminalis]|nr:hypothetical protein FQR65_LT15478 [Abscondita terminalis]